MNRTFQLLALLFLICSAIPLQAQFSEEEEDVVYLKNGSMIRGEITERVIGEGIKIEILGGSVLAFPESEVETILKAPKVYTPTPAVPAQLSFRSWRKERPITNRERGIYNMVSYGFQPSSDVWGDVVPWPTLHYRTGYHFNQYINLGIGFGIDPYGPGGTVPIYADFHGELGKVKRLMPHYYLQAGYGAGAWTNWAFEDFKGGPMGHFGLGWKLNSRSHAEWLFTLGYKLQSAEYTQIEDPWIWQPVQGEGPIRELFQAVVILVSFGF